MRKFTPAEEGKKLKKRRDLRRGGKSRSHSSPPFSITSFRSSKRITRALFRKEYRFSEKKKEKGRG